MKTFVPVAVIFALLAPSWARVASARPVAPENDAAACALVRAISPKLSGWTASYQPHWDVIEFERDEAVPMPPEPMFNAPAVLGQTMKMGRPSFSFRVEPLVSRANYGRFEVENATINQRLERMRAHMKTFRSKFDSFAPKNAAQQRQVDAYNHLKKSLHSLPDYFYKNISLSWLTFPGHLVSFDRPGETPAFAEDAMQKTGWQREQSEAARAFLQIVSRYESAPK